MGSLDSPLTAAGWRQADELAAAAVEVGVVSLVTSPQGRARATAGVVAKRLGVPLAVDDRLRESSRGAWEGRLAEDIAREEPERWSAWQRPGADFRFPGGESLGEHLARVAEALGDLARLESPVLAVSHGGTVRCALIHTRGLEPECFPQLRVSHAEMLELAPE